MTISSWTIRSTRRASHFFATSASTSTSWRASDLPDLADSIMPKYPDLLGISEDEGTAWIVRGDTADDRRTKQGLRLWRKGCDRPAQAVSHAVSGRHLQPRDAPRDAPRGPTIRGSSRRFIDSLFKQILEPVARRRDGARRAGRLCIHRPIVRHSRPAQVHADDNGAAVRGRRDRRGLQGAVRAAARAAARGGAALRRTAQAAVDGERRPTTTHRFRTV